MSRLKGFLGDGSGFFRGLDFTGEAGLELVSKISFIKESAIKLKLTAGEPTPAPRERGLVGVFSRSDSGSETSLTSAWF